MQTYTHRLGETPEPITLLQDLTGRVDVAVVPGGDEAGEAPLLEGTDRQKDTAGADRSDPKMASAGILGNY